MKISIKGWTIAAKLVDDGARRLYRVAEVEADALSGVEGLRFVEATDTPRKPKIVVLMKITGIA